MTSIIKTHWDTEAKTSLRVQKTGQGMLRLSADCSLCGKQHKIENVKEDGYNLWKRGVQLAIALPDVTLDDAFFMMFGECPYCQNGDWENSLGEEIIE